MAVIAPMDGQASSVIRHAPKDILVKTAPFPVNVRMVPVVILSMETVGVHLGSAESCARMAVQKASMANSAIRSATVLTMGAVTEPMARVCVTQGFTGASVTFLVLSGLLGRAALRSVTVSNKTPWSVIVKRASVSVNLVTMVTRAKKNVLQGRMGQAVEKSVPALLGCHVTM